MKSVDPFALVLALLVNFAAIRLGSYLLPDAFYFSFSAFLFDNRDLVKPVALAIKLATPFLTAFALTAAVMALLRVQRDFILPGRTPRLDLAALARDQLPLTLAFAAFFAALLMAWPYILLWDLLIDPSLVRYRLIYLVAYFAYFTGYALFALAGANTAVTLLAPDRPRLPLTWATLTTHPLTKPLFEAVGGGISATLAAFLASRAGG